MIVSLKETLESDESVKKAMQNKIIDLKNRIDTYKEEILKRGGTVDDYPGDQHNLIQKYRYTIMEMNDHKNNERRGFEYMLASTAIANEHQTKIFREKSKTKWGRFRHKFHNFLQFFVPFKNDINLIAYRYNVDVFEYFQISRFLFILSFFVLFSYVYFLVKHISYFDFNSKTNPMAGMCRFNLPCILFYSRIPVSEANAFSIAYITMTFTIFYFSLLKWIGFKRLHLNGKLYDREETKFSQFFFTSWDWSIKAKASYLEKKKRLRNLYKFSLEEVELMNEIKHRTSNEMCHRVGMRIFSYFLSIIWLIIYGGVIYGAYIIRGVLKSKDPMKTTYEPIDMIYDVLPSILIIIANFFFPWVFKQFSKMEKWDYQKTLTNQMAVRYFLCRVWGLAAIYFVNIYFNILGNSLLNKFIDSKANTTTINESTFGCPGYFNITSQITDPNATLISQTSYSNCKEDDVIINLLMVVILEFVIRKFSDLIGFLLLYMCSSKRKLGLIYKYPFNPRISAVDFFIFNIQLYAIICHFPFIVAITPIILFLEFKFDFYKLKTLRSKPIKFNIQSENGFLIMFLFIFTVFLIIVFNTVFYISKSPHGNFVNVIIFFI